MIDGHGVQPLRDSAARPPNTPGVERAANPMDTLRRMDEGIMPDVLRDLAAGRLPSDLASGFGGADAVRAFLDRPENEKAALKAERSRRV